MKRSVLSFILAILSITSFASEPVVKTGIEVLRDRGFDILIGKRVGHRYTLGHNRAVVTDHLCLVGVL